METGVQLRGGKKRKTQGKKKRKAKKKSKGGEKNLRRRGVS